MTRNQRILIGAGALVFTGVLIFAVRRAKSKKILRDVSDEGYETAHDVLYPKRGKVARTHYGPVLPS